MATWKTEVEKLAGATDTALDAWLVEGAWDVINKIKIVFPQTLELYSSETTINAGSGVDLVNTDTVTMVSRDDVFAARVPLSHAARASDSSSIYAATAGSPIFFIKGNKLYIKPDPDEMRVGSVYIVGVDASFFNEDGNPFDVSSFKTFPYEKRHLVTNYTAQKVLQEKIMGYSISTMGSPATKPGVISLDTVSYTAPASTAVVAVSDVELSTEAFSDTPPVYTPPLCSVDFDDVFDDFLAGDEDSELASVELQKQNNILQQYSGDIQNATALFNQENAAYQISFQEFITGVQAENQAAIQDMQKDLAIAQANAQLTSTKLLQDAIQTTQAIMANNTSDIQRHQSEMSLYAAESQSIIQKYGADLQADSLKIKNLQDTLMLLKQEYMQVFAIPQGEQK